ncbi:MAG: hypothetical protein KBS41_03150, partial [Oscillospiraceae bacterium]|nr:hypothetical protein [Candidatus Equicaccousia limihippi]
YRFEFAYDAETKSFNWESEDMQSLYSFCKEMQKRGIDIALNACWWQPHDVWNEAFTPDNDTEAGTQNYAKFISESLHQIIEVHGCTNVKYLVMFTEPQRGTADALRGVHPYDWWLKFSRAAHGQLVKDGRRNLVKFMGPNEGSTTTSTMLKYVAPKCEDFIDIFSSHNYHAVTDLDESDIRTGKYVLMHGCPTHCRTQQKITLKPNTDYEMSLYCKIKGDFSKPMEGDIMFGALDLEQGSEFFKCMPPESSIHEGSTIRIPYTELKPGWNQYKHTFNSKDRGDCYIGFFFNVYQDGCIGLFDSISLKEKGSDVELIKNGDFEEYSDVWEQFGSSEYACENYYDWDRWTNVGLQYVPKGKEFWFDEYNWSGGIENPLRGTELALAQTAFLNCGIQSSLIWSLFDQQWPNSHIDSSDSFYDGDHRCGVMPNLRRSLKPYAPYYAFGLLGHYLGGGEGTKVYAGEIIPGRRVYLSSTERPDGNVTVLVVNRSGKTQDFEIDLGKFAGKKFYRHLYDPKCVEITEEAKRIPADKELTGIKDTLEDYTFAVYTT